MGTTHWALLHPHALPPQTRWLQLLRDCLTLGQRRDKLNLFRVAALRSGPLTVVHKVQVGLEISVVFTLARVSTTLRRYTRVRLKPFTASLVLRDEPLQLPALCNSLHPSGEDLSHSYLLLRHLGGSKALGAAKSQDLTISWTRESLTPRFALIKLAEDRGVSEEAPLATEFSKECGAPAWQGSVPSIAGRSALASPTYDGVEAPVSSGCPSILCFVRTGRLTAGLFPWGIREGAYKRKFTQEKLREERRVRLYTVPSWPAGQQEDAAPPPAYAWHQSSLVQEWHPQSRKPSVAPSLDLHKANRKIRRPAAARKKSLAKNFSLGSQFNGFRSLEGPFTDSIA
ncbi:LOW QUALITY PROTEIN: hypothetical protein Cgig2_007584 [Carnegiea gigantea]|uniref:Uncharacterized protein n=1 Tax=Carnegiea gigantea TaxID=171969 RepID=A0A9Q1QA30_9CARY|nr:LOW QUALITY PROTEIN: hypothetical protein Cgig2_007584 [Carnegiea gigantea]